MIKDWSTAGTDTTVFFGEVSILCYVYVVVQFSPWFNFYPLFLCLMM